MLKKYLADIAFMQILNLLIKPIWILVIDRAVQNTLSLEVYGNYAALFNFSLMFFIILDLGLRVGLAVNAIAFSVGQRPNEILLHCFSCTESAPADEVHVRFLADRAMLGRCGFRHDAVCYDDL